MFFELITVQCAMCSVQRAVCLVCNVWCAVFGVQFNSSFVLLQNTSRAVISGQGQKGVPRVELHSSELNCSLSHCIAEDNIKFIDNK